MSTNPASRLLRSERVQASPRLLLAPVPLPLVRPFLTSLVRRVASRRPELFERLGDHTRTRFLIDPVNLPFVVLLVPDVDRPRIEAHRRGRAPPWDARVAGTVLKLLDMVDGEADGDALFFSRDLVVEGDVEAVVTLRNALDDLDGSIADDIAGVLHGPGRMILAGLRRVGRLQ